MEDTKQNGINNGDTVNGNAEKPSLFGMILQPTEQLQRIRENPKILVALIIVSILSAIGMVMMSTGIDMSDMSELEGLGEEELAIVNVIGQIGFAITGLFTPIVTIFISTVILFIVAKVLQSDVTFKQLFSMNTYISIISALGILLNGLLIMIMPTGSDMYMTSLNSVIKAEGALGGFLEAFEVFSIWMFVVTAIGLQVVAKFSKKAAWTVIIILFVITALFTTIGATLEATFGV